MNSMNFVRAEYMININDKESDVNVILFCTYMSMAEPCVYVKWSSPNVLVKNSSVL